MPFFFPMVPMVPMGSLHARIFATSGVRLLLFACPAVVGGLVSSLLLSFFCWGVPRAHQDVTLLAQKLDSTVLLADEHFPGDGVGRTCGGKGVFLIHLRVISTSIDGTNRKLKVMTQLAASTETTESGV